MHHESEIYIDDMMLTNSKKHIIMVDYIKKKI